MWGQTWDNLIDLVTPYPNVEKVDLTSALKAKKFSTLDIFRVIQRNSKHNLVYKTVSRTVFT